MKIATKKISSPVSFNIFRKEKIYLSSKSLDYFNVKPKSKHIFKMNAPCAGLLRKRPPLSTATACGTAGCSEGKLVAKRRKVLFVKQKPCHIPRERRPRHKASEAGIVIRSFGARRLFSRSNFLPGILHFAVNHAEPGLISLPAFLERVARRSTRRRFSAPRFLFHVS